jgi:hypothetical protein
VRSCLEDPLAARERARRAASRDAGRFTPERHARGLLEIYDRVLTGSPGEPQVAGAGG